MKEFFINLDDVGFKDANDVATYVSNRDPNTNSLNLEKTLPQEYLKVIDGYSDEKRKNKLKNIVNNINLFLKTKFNDTNIYSQWYSFGIIPNYFHKGMNSKSLAHLASKIIRARNAIKDAEYRIRELNNNGKDNKRNIMSLDSSHKKLQLNIENLKKYEEEFYFELVDFESSLGGVY
ncbi:hypothetical protein ACOZZ1_002032 [Vibrio fluvialis]